MKADELLMRKVLKEEYDKRINFFLNEKITLTTKYGANVIADAIGLKVFDKAVFRYTFAGIVKKEDETEFAKLVLPEEPLGNEKGSGRSHLFEDDDLGGDSGLGFIVRRDKESGKRDIEFDTSSASAFDDYREDLPKIRDDQEGEGEQTAKEPKYILVPMGEFEERFSIS